MKFFIKITMFSLLSTLPSFVYAHEIHPKSCLTVDEKEESENDAFLSSDEEDQEDDLEMRYSLIEASNIGIILEDNTRVEFTNTLAKLKENLVGQENVSKEIHTRLKILSRSLNSNASIAQILNQYSQFWVPFSVYLRLQQTYFQESFCVERDIRSFNSKYLSFKRVLDKLEENKKCALHILNRFGSASTYLPEEYIHSLTVKSIHDRIFDGELLQSIKIKFQKLIEISNETLNKENTHLCALINIILTNIDHAETNKDLLDIDLWNLETHQAPTVFTYNAIAYISKNVERYENSIQSKDSVIFYIQDMHKKICDLLDGIINTKLLSIVPKKRGIHDEYENY